MKNKHHLNNEKINAIQSYKWLWPMAIDDNIANCYFFGKALLDIICNSKLRIGDKQHQISRRDNCNKFDLLTSYASVSMAFPWVWVRGLGFGVGILWFVWLIVSKYTYIIIFTYRFIICFFE